MSDVTTTAKVEADLELCQAYGVCAQIAPAVYDLDDDGYVALVGDGSVSPDQVTAAREAADACPVRAIMIG